MNDKHTAEALQALSGTITVRDGSKLLVHVRQCGPPKITTSLNTDSSSIDEDVLKVLYICPVLHCTSLLRVQN